MATINQPQKRESDLDIVIKGLQAIGGIMDIRKTYEEAEKIKAVQEQELATKKKEADELDRKRANKLYTGEITSLLGDKKIVPVPEGATGDVNIMEQRAPGEIGVAETPRTFMSQGAYEQYTGKQSQLLQQKKTEQEQSEKSTKNQQEINRIASERRKEFTSRVEDTDGPMKNLRGVRKAADIYSRDGLGVSDDIAVINVYARLLSPGIVSDNDFNNAAKAGGLKEQAQAYYDTAIGQGKLTEKQRAELLQTIQSIGSGYSDEFRKTAEAYRAQAIKEGLDPEDVVTPDRMEFVSDIDSRFTKAFKNILSGKRDQKQTEKTVMQKIGDAIMPSAKAEKQKDAFSGILED